MNICLLLLFIYAPLALCQTCPSVSLCDYSQLSADGKECFYLCRQNQFTGGVNICQSKHLTPLKIDKEWRNDVGLALLNYQKVSSAYIGLSQRGDGWEWIDGSDLEGTPVAHHLLTPTHLPGQTTPVPVVSTVEPSERRRNMSVVMMLDASIYSSIEWSVNQITFYQNLAARMTARGWSEFAYMMYGCDSSVSSKYYKYADFIPKLRTLTNATLGCTRVNPTTFSNQMDLFIFNYYSGGASQRKSYANMAGIIFSSATNVSVISQASKPNTASGTCIGISVGPNAVSMSSFSQPSKNTIKIDNFDDMESIVEQVDNMIFSAFSSYDSEGMIDKNYDLTSELASSPDKCAVLDSSTGNWNPVDCSESHQMICNGTSNAPPEPVTLDPDTNPCAEDFDPIDGINNTCFQLSTDQLSFSETLSNCQASVTPYLTSLASMMPRQVAMINDYLSDKSATLVWIGLMSIANNGTFVWVNGDPFNQSTGKWREGYPRITDGAQCVALAVSIDATDEDPPVWINIECNRKLQGLCSYTYL